jgi:methylenetetrahydrofolate reductase (NADPH)
VGSPRAELEHILSQYWRIGVRHIVALRGDMPGGPGTPYEAHPEGCANAAALTAFARSIAAFEVSVAVYPERHPDSRDWEQEIDNFKAKLDAGASRGISQFFFDAETFLRFRDRLADAGVSAPVIPGVMPVTNVAAMMKMAAACGASLPRWLQRMCEGLDADPQTRMLVAAALSAELCARLNAEGVEEFHFYTLNRAELTVALCRMLGVREPATVEAAA